ncbi:MAG TPA: RNA polymerase sigma factor RpoD/SigA [Bacteroidia bacterium]|jgi:RNA polymerase primary sigma factor|nr:RNA polymerase sigma factor RpoD/SigA [Bacteroidia bacterium]
MRQLKISQRITTRETLGLDKYLQDISREDLISPEEEVILARKIQNGDMQALEKLTKANLRFVVSVAKQYQNRGLGLQDLINEGNLGLLKSATKFDPTKGFKFISYAVWWIRQTIQQALLENSRLVRLPVNKVNANHKIIKTVARLEQEFGREPSSEEVANITKMSEEEVKASMQVFVRTVSMDAPLTTNDEGGTLYDVIEDETAVSPEGELLKESLKLEVLRTLAAIHPREADILKCYFGLGEIKQPMLVDEIARRLDISPERVRQLKEKAIRNLRNSAKSNLLKTYLG